ncbi:MAG: EthD family reductase [Terriglobia bacterium]
MIRVIALYSNKPGAKFDFKYYTEKHMAMAKEKLKPYGLVRVEVDKGVSGLTAAVPAPYVAIGQVVFHSLEELQKGLAAHGQELMSDIPNYTNIEPQIQISEIVS